MHIFNPTETIVTTLFLILFIVVPISYTQQLSREELDSDFTMFIQVRAPHLLEQPGELTAEERKCGLEIVNRVKFNFNSFSIEQQAVLKPLLQRPVMQTSIISPSGFFRIHYDTTGASIPSYVNSASIQANVQEVVKTLDSTYSFEVNYLGYPQPPSDGNEGGDNLYDVYIINQPSGLYGFTLFENEVEPGSERYTSYLVIDNNYTGYFSEGVNGLQVTAAHEFHHAIQGGNYIFRPSDIYFYEITSTAMEEFVYDDVNDYYAYMSSYFRTPETPLPQTTGYNTAAWNIYLRDNFDYDIIKLQWELMPSLRAIFAINNSLFEYESSFAKEFNKFGIWIYFTNYKSVPGKYFEEAANYPLIEPTSIIQFNQSHSPLDMISKAAAQTFITFVVQSNNDSLVTIVSNGDVESAVGGLNNSFNFGYSLFSDSSSGDRFLTENYSSQFTADNPAFWSVSEILNNVVVREDDASFLPPDESTFTFPNPFNYGFNNEIVISLNAKNGETVELNIYSISMELVYKSEKTTTLITKKSSNFFGISWNALNENSERLASGVYIYVIKRGDDVVKGKVVIFNE